MLLTGIHDCALYSSTNFRKHCLHLLEFRTGVWAQELPLPSQHSMGPCGKETQWVTQGMKGFSCYSL
jgi:hypothetical protein